MKVVLNKLVIFGAGKIGRSFIGQLFSRGGYEVVFVDIYEPVIEELNRRKQYEVVFVSDQSEKSVIIGNVRGVHIGNEETLIDEITTTGLIAVSVGAMALKQISPLIAKGLLKRYTEAHNRKAVDIIIAENMRNAAEYLRNEFLKYLPHDYPIDQLVGFVETSIGKMVPLSIPGKNGDDLLKVYAEPYNTLIVDQSGFINSIPEIKGLAPKKNIKAWVDRKLFIHNMGHAATAYIGYVSDPHLIYIHQALSDRCIYKRVKETMLQTAAILIEKYPEEFSWIELTNHVEDLLNRFQNKALGDTIIRVGSDLMRKLSPDDRLAGAIRMAVSLGKAYDKVLYALVCATHFMEKESSGHSMQEDVRFVKKYGNDPSLVLSEVCGFDPRKNPFIYQQASEINDHLFHNLKQHNDANTI